MLRNNCAIGICDCHSVRGGLRRRQRTDGRASERTVEVDTAFVHLGTMSIFGWSGADLPEELRRLSAGRLSLSRQPSS